MPQELITGNTLLTPGRRHCAGIIPASFTDQQAAQRLAVCNDIGEASYVDSLIAASLLDTFTALPSARSLRRRLEQRYGVEFSEDMTGAHSDP